MSKFVKLVLSLEIITPLIIKKIVIRVRTTRLKKRNQTSQGDSYENFLLNKRENVASMSINE